MADVRQLRFSSIGHVPSLRDSLTKLEGRLVAEAGRAFLFRTKAIDEWVIVTSRSADVSFAYRAAVQGCAGALICRISLSAPTRCTFPEVRGSGCSVGVGDALVVSGGFTCEERPTASGSSTLITVLRR